ncbi:MAG: DUF3160 domain-containing protein [Actinobacteria bacterium]|nr:DUF3160 domain-containing protein [Actinomycetota bacterium]
MALLALTLSLGACTSDSGTTTTSGGPVTTRPGGQNVSAETKPFPTPAYLQPAPVDLGAVENLSQVKLTQPQKDVLARQGFVVTPDLSEWRPQKFWQVYEEARYSRIPLLVTTDTILNAYHTIFDTTLTQLEETAFIDKALAMSRALRVSASAQADAAKDDKVQQAALANEAYFAVGESLLKGTLTSPDRVHDTVAAELALIDAAAGLDESPILGYLEDYSQYKPRGHYTRSEGLKRYFKAMMWYGHTAFWLQAKEPDVGEELATRLTRQAALISLSLTGDAEQAWKAIYEPTAFMVGTSDDITAADMRPAMGVAFGSQSPSLADLADDQKIGLLQDELQKLPPPTILTGANSEPLGTPQEETERSFRVMGQRYIPDSYAFQQLTWRWVGTEEKKREYPMGLDAMAVLGSDQAFALAKTTYGQDAYQDWEAQLKKVKGQFDTRSPAFWPTNLYTGWLDGLRLVFAFPPEKAPDLMKTQVWARKGLNAALGSWTELRHDTILYAKQSVVAEGGGDEPLYTAGYVEPYPAFYDHMGRLATTTKEGLSAYGLLGQDLSDKLQAMADLCFRLKGIADKELSGQALNQEEQNTILYIGSELEHLELFSDTEGRTLSPADEKSPVVADVHTNLNARTALEEGTGYPQVLYTVMELDGKQLVLVGASYSYYEFIVPMDKRMTDEEWQGVLDAGTAPPRPVWTDEFIAK